MKIAIYARVSTDDKDQNPERQILKCRQYCELHNHEVVCEISEHHKGNSSPLYRPQFKEINLKKVDGVIVETIDRLTRQHPTKVMNLLNYFKDSGVLIISVREPIFNMESEFSEPMQYFMTWWNNYFLKKLSADVKSGLERAVANGKKLGRPKNKINYYEVMRLKKDMSLRKIAIKMNISLGAVQRCIKNPPSK
jgi:DNA invertase Pin-like site-specific DNA recombinase